MEDDCSNLANLMDIAFEEELLTLAYYTLRPYIVLPIARASHMDDFLAYRHRKERQLL